MRPAIHNAPSQPRARNQMLNPAPRITSNSTLQMHQKGK